MFLLLCGLCVLSGQDLFYTEKLLLALRAIMRSPASDYDLLDGSFTGQAGFAFTTVGAVLDLEEARLAIRANVIRDR